MTRFSDLSRALGVIAAVLLVCTGCARTRPVQPGLFAVVDSYVGDGDFIGSALVRVDRRSLQPFGRRLRLGDAATSRVLSPDRRTLALGGTNFGEVLFVDRASLGRVRRLTAVPGAGVEGNIEVDVESWTRNDRVIAVATRLGAWWAPHPSRLLVIDPRGRRVIRRVALQGGVLASAALRDGTVALLVTPLAGGAAGVVVVRPDGSSWRAQLRRLDLQGGPGVRVAGVSYRPGRVPALAGDGRNRIFVVAPDRPIAEIDVRSHTTRYHDVSLPPRVLLDTPTREPGTGGVALQFYASAEWLGRNRLAIGRSDERPGRLPGGGTGHWWRKHMIDVVDTRSWRVSPVVPATRCERLGGMIACSASTGGFGVDGKRSRGSGLVLYTAGWSRRYRARASELWWTTAARRLFAGAPDGSRVAELDPRTGRPIRAIEPPPLRNGTWPLDLFTW